MEMVKVTLKLKGGDVVKSRTFSGVHGVVTFEPKVFSVAADVAAALEAKGYVVNDGQKLARIHAVPKEK